MLPEDFEQKVEQILRDRVNAQCPGIVPNVFHRKRYLGTSGHDHEIDVSAELSVAGVRIVVAVECKKYKARVGVDDALEFAQRLQDIGAHKGIIATTNGFQEGAIRIDGHDIRSLKVKPTRSQIGQVLQDSVIFNTTLRNNIRYGRPNVTEQEIMVAARVAEIHEFVMRTSDGYDTLVGDEGIKLSVGEKQRLAIARAVLTDPSILILDEATSSLDSISEALIQKAMANVLKGRTAFVIAHRLSTVVNADLIAVMDEGRIVEQGTHDELLEQPESRYRALYERQFASLDELAAD